MKESHRGGCESMSAPGHSLDLATFGVAAVSFEHSAGFELFRQGRTAQDVYWVQSGLTKLVSLNEDGDETIIGLRSSGWFLGATSAILRKPYPVTATTVTDCKLYRFSAEQ